jgi:hypothetical protein
MIFLVTSCCSIALRSAALFHPRSYVELPQHAFHILAGNGFVNPNSKVGAIAKKQLSGHAGTGRMNWHEGQFIGSVDTRVTGVSKLWATRAQGSSLAGQVR